jgi:hypothetical protein
MALATQNVESQLSEFRISDAAIAAMAEDYLPLVIAGIDDADGFRKVHEARMVVKSKRVEVEKVRKALKEDALKYGRMVDAEAKRITALIAPIETHLKEQEDAYNAEKERIRNAARLKAEAEARAKAEAEAARLRAEQEAESERLRVERKKIEAERAAIEAERRKIEAEQRRIAEAEAAKRRAEEMERAQAEAAERAKRETEERIARQAAEAKAKADAEEAARIKAEALKPDREKLLAVAQALKAMQIPSVSAAASEAAEKVRRVILRAATQVTDIVSAL